MIAAPQTRHSRWSCDGRDVVSTIVLVGRMLHRLPGRRKYRRLYTVEVEFGTKVLRVRGVPLDEAPAWEQRLVYLAFVELGALGSGAARA